MSEKFYNSPEAYFSQASHLASYFREITEREIDSHGEFYLSDPNMITRPHSIHRNQNSTFSPDIHRFMEEIDTDSAYESALDYFTQDFYELYGDVSNTSSRQERFVSAIVQSIGMINNYLEPDLRNYHLITKKLELGLSGDSGFRIIFNVPINMSQDTTQLVFSQDLDDEPERYSLCSSMKFARKLTVILTELTVETGLLDDFPGLNSTDSNTNNIETLLLIGFCDWMKEEATNAFIQSHNEALESMGLDYEELEA